MEPPKALPTVSIHAPAWGATIRAALSAAWMTFCFNPRARMGRDVLRGRNSLITIRFQSTRPHGARLGDEFANIARPVVSIHAPAWGATRLILEEMKKLFVSIHAPAWGATIEKLAAQNEKLVSIHAPAWGATAVALRWLPVHALFQSTRPHGARH